MLVRWTVGSVPIRRNPIRRNTNPDPNPKIGFRQNGFRRNRKTPNCHAIITNNQFKQIKSRELCVTSVLQWVSICGRELAPSEYKITYKIKLSEKKTHSRPGLNTTLTSTTSSPTTTALRRRQRCVKDAVVMMDITSSAPKRWSESKWTVVIITSYCHGH